MRPRSDSISTCTSNHCQCSTEQFKFTNFVIILVILLAVISTSRGVLSQNVDNFRRTFVPATANCSNLTLVHFLNFFPCVHVSSSADVERCDIFAYVAAEMAVERINSDSTILPNTEVRLAPISNLATTVDELNLRIDPIIETLRVVTKDKQVKTTLWGIGGPLTARQADAIASIVSIENAGVMIVSYNIRDATLNKPKKYQSTFYRSLPSDNTLSAARLSLLNAFQWKRIGLINLNTPFYSQMTNTFRALLSNSFDSKRVAYKEHFSDLDHLDFLDNLRIRDIRIIVGFFGPSEARTILCEAKSHDLTTADHVWILPAYYNPNWWKSPPLDSEIENGCTDNEILDILNKLVIFIDGVKFPTLDLSMTQFYSQLVIKAKQLFPSLTNVNYSRYLQHSRATSAYDAVMLLARSLDLVVDRGDDLCHDPVRVQTALERCLINCEQCRLFYGDSSSVRNNTECELCANKASCDLNSTFQELRSPQALDLYGQVLVSQFINRTSCPIALYWPHCEQAEGELVGISDLAEHPCAGQKVGLNRNTSFLGIHQCPTDFQWKGGSPPRSNAKRYTFIPLTQFAPIAALTVLGMLVGVILITLHIIWRNNKHIKVSSPRLNVMFVIGFLLQLSSLTIYDTLILSAGVYNIAERFRTPLCQLQTWSLHSGSVLMLATLLVKNWRIHRIFHNKGLKQIKNWKLADGTLVLVILAILTPALVVLSVWTAQSPYTYQERELKDRFQVITLTFCGSEHSAIWEYIVLSYEGFLAVSLFVVGLSASKVPASYAADGRTAQRMVLLFAIVVVIFVVVQVAIALNPFKWYLKWWISLIWTLCLPVALLLMLLLPQVCFVIADAVRKKKNKKEEKDNNKISNRHSTLLEESINLKNYLAEMDEELTELKFLSSH